MPLPSTDRAVSPDDPAELVTAMVRAGLSSADVRRRLHVLFPEQAPSFWSPWLRRGVFDNPPAGPARRRAPYDDRQLSLGVEVVAAVALGLTPDPRAAPALDQEDVDVLEDLTGLYDPSGAILANCLMLIGALRQHLQTGERPVLRQDAYQRLLMDIRLVADVPDSHRLRWPPSPSVVARRLGAGDWSRALERIGLDGGRPAAPLPPARGAARQVQELDDPGIGLIAAPAQTGEAGEEAWDELCERVADELAGVAWRDVLVLRYTPPQGTEVPPPSAWARTGPDGTYVHLSGINGSSALWPFQAEYFRTARWREPADHGVAWNAGPLTFEAAAELMVEGMRVGRLCTDPYRFCWGVGHADARSDAEDAQLEDADAAPGAAGPAQDEAASSAAEAPIASVVAFPHPAP